MVCDKCNNTEYFIVTDKIDNKTVEYNMCSKCGKILGEIKEPKWTKTPKAS